MTPMRPCRICKRWFRPHPRAGDRQRVCSEPDCQSERHRRSCRSWRERNPDYDREDRLRRRLRPVDGARGGSPELDWSVARDAVGLEVVVVIDETRKDLESRLRDAVIAQQVGRGSVSSKHPGVASRDAIATEGRSP